MLNYFTPFLLGDLHLSLNCKMSECIQSTKIPSYDEYKETRFLRTKNRLPGAP